MMPEKHEAEEDRLLSLDSLEILDTDPEKEFDDVVQLASAICGVPMSLISLVDRDRQWFKARVGVEASETPLEESICAHGILNGEYFEVPDTHVNPLTADNPLVTGDMQLRFYAGAILRTSEGMPVGSLCVLDRKPRRLTPFQRDALKVLARQLITQMELKRALAEANVLRREVDHRVKNSLQSVSALTRIQARHAKGEEARLALDLVQRRIETIATLHEQLYKAERGDRVHLEEFISSVCRLIGSAAPPQVRLTHAAPRLQIGPAEAAAIGVILNEFCSNSFKHAFPDGRTGHIRIEAVVISDTEARLTLTDDGVGLPAEIVPGLGLQVMEASARQLGHNYQQDSSPGGVTISIDFEFLPD